MARSVPDLLPKFDRAGREQREPRRLGHGVRYATRVAEWMPPKLVPPEFWSQDVDEDKLAVAIVSCPCGHTPTVQILGPLASCDAEECDRAFFFDGANVWAFNSPTKPASDDETPVEFTRP